MHSLTTVGVAWSMLSFAVAILCSTGFYMPYWLNGEIGNVTVHYGVFRRCYPSKDINSTQAECGRYKRFNDIPSTEWQVTTLILGAACGVLVLVSFISLLAMCFEDIITKRTARVCGAFQALAGKSLKWDSFKPFTSLLL